MCACTVCFVLEKAVNSIDYASLKHVWCNRYNAFPRLTYNFGMFVLYEVIQFAVQDECFNPNDHSLTFCRLNVVRGKERGSRMQSSSNYL